MIMAGDMGWGDYYVEASFFSYYTPGVVQKGFYVFEGLDGSGTTTQARLAAEAASSDCNAEGKDYPVVCGAEPTGLDTGELVRRYLQGKSEMPGVSNPFLSCLFAADRINHLERIQNLVVQGYRYFSDRYLFSSLVYQGIMGRDVTSFRLNSGLLLPEIVFFLEVSPELALSRVREREDATGNHKPREIYERDLESLEAAAKAYDIVMRWFECNVPAVRVVRLDGSRHWKELHGEIMGSVGMGTSAL